MYVIVLAITVLVSRAAAQGTLNGIQPGATYAPSKSPVFPSNLTTPTGVVTNAPTNEAGVPTGTLSQNPTLVGYPPTWVIAPTTAPEVQAAINAIDWSLVPNSTVKTFNNGNPNIGSYPATDPYCWWSDTNCVNPKVSYLPPDIWYCPRDGDWGLTYDDGPLNLGTDAVANQYAEPNLYDFLVAHNQTATLFYIGSNVWGFPQAAQRALADGNIICVHTWSHNPSTSLTNGQMVAELYYTLKVIKEVLGITPKCWRPPYGDVDDRIRSIAWQMGMQTIIWDEDTNDWDMPPGGTLSPTTVNGYFQGWINAYKGGNDTVHGHIVLEHELNNATVAMAEKWLPTLQETFRVVPVQSCMNISQPYWESNFVYPTEANPSPVANSSSSVVSSSTAQVQTTPGAVTPTSSAPTPTLTSTSTGTSDAVHVVGLSIVAMLMPILVMLIQL